MSPEIRKTEIFRPQWPVSSRWRDWWLRGSSISGTLCQ